MEETCVLGRTVTRGSREGEVRGGWVVGGVRPSTRGGGYVGN